MLINEWWAQVTEIPDVIKIIVFKRGILNGLKISIPQGGQFNPNSKVGDILEWKKAQKKEIKNKTSEVINRTIPHFNPFNTWFVWYPWKVLSRDTSRHHVYIVNKIIRLPIIIISNCLLWNIFVDPVNSVITPIAPVRGQGL